MSFGRSISPRRDHRLETELDIDAFLSSPLKDAALFDRMTKSLVWFAGRRSNNRHPIHLKGHQKLLDFLLKPQIAGQANAKNVWNSLTALACLTHQESYDPSTPDRNELMDDPRVAGKIADALVEDPLCLNPEGCPSTLASMALRCEPQTAPVLLSLIEQTVPSLKTQEHRPTSAPQHLRPESAPTILTALYKSAPDLGARIVAVACTKGIMTTELRGPAFYFFNAFAPMFPADHDSDLLRLPLIGLFNDLLERKLKTKDWGDGVPHDVEDQKRHIEIIGSALGWYHSPPVAIAAQATPLLNRMHQLLEQAAKAHVSYAAPPEPVPPDCGAVCPRRPSGKSYQNKSRLPYGTSGGSFGVKITIPEKLGQQHTLGDS